MRVCKRFENATLDNYVCESETQKKLVAAIKDGIQNGFKQNILLIGAVGTGKTHLAYAILNALAERYKISNGQDYYRENEVVYRPIKAIIDEIKDAWNKHETPDREQFCEVPLLIIDEIGVQYGTDSERTEMYEVFNRRYENMLPIIAISNHDEKALQRILGQRIFDRLTGGALIFELAGKSFRQNGANNGRN